MRRILLLVATCLLTTTLHAQPTPEDVTREQNELQRRLTSYSFESTLKIEVGRKSKTFRWHSVGLDNGRRFAGNTLVSAVRVGGVTFSHLDEVAVFSGLLLHGMYGLHYIGTDGDSFVYEVLRDSPTGFKGFLWVDRQGRLLKAKGVWLYPESVTAEHTLLMGGDGFPVSVMAAGEAKDKNGRVKYRINREFFNYRRFTSPEPVVELGDIVP